jgi:hypothetical protein
MKKLLAPAIGILLASVQSAQAVFQVPAIPEPGALGLFALGVAATVVGVRYIRRR